MTKLTKKNILHDILSSILLHSERTAFVIEGESYTYGQLGDKTGGIMARLSTVEEETIGIVAENCFETYASLLAVLFSGKTYVMLHPSYPFERNLNIARLGGIKTVLRSENKTLFDLSQAGINCIDTRSIAGRSVQLKEVDSLTPAYLIFTSGSTGEPKGVPITRSNLNAFYDGYSQLGWQLSAEDRMLQMFELTFDVSIVSTLYPLTVGAAVYTVGYGEVKHLKVIELLEEQQLTFAAVTPSLLQLLSDYFDEIRLPALRYLVVTAEASQVDLLQRFRPSAPNAEFVNLYGPTEATIYCTCYKLPMETSKCKQHNGMLAIGRPFEGIEVKIADENGQPLPLGEVGELWVTGEQVMCGYHNNPLKSAEALIWVAEDACSGNLYYKTGDLCYQDEEGDIIYCGRKDSQVKMQGFRIELSEIEYTAKQFFNPPRQVVVLPLLRNGLCSELHLAVEAERCDTEKLSNYLHSKLPHYMLPKAIHCIRSFPVTNSHKIDRKEILKRYTI